MANIKDKIENINDDLLPEYDFDYSKGVRGKYYKRLISGQPSVTLIKRRRQLLKEIKEAEREYKEGKCRTASVKEIMKDILS